jgi:ferredoxin-NADP reductase
LEEGVTVSEVAREDAPIREPARSESFDAKLVSARPMSSSVRELVFERTDEKPVHFEPGQWLNLMVRKADGTEAKRAYSIASAPRGDSRFELAVTRVDGGEASHVLHDMSVGQSVRAIGPSGLFTRGAHEESSALFIGTGTGVTPLRSMLLAATEKAETSNGRLWLLFGVRNEADILYREELEKLAATHKNVRLFISLSRPESGWKGLAGYVQSHVRDLWTELGDPQAHAYICGLERMVKSVKDVLRNELGVGRKQVHQERYD